jgi:hypothetical protein
MEALRMPGKTRYELGRLQLAVENPEQYRAKLLGQIAQEIKKTREAISASEASRWKASRVLWWCGKRMIEMSSYS